MENLVGPVTFRKYNLDSYSVFGSTYGCDCDMRKRDSAVHGMHACWHV